MKQKFQKLAVIGSVFIFVTIIVLIKINPPITQNTQKTTIKNLQENNLNNKISGTEILIRGTLSLRGNEPFLIIGLEAENKENYLIISDAHLAELKKLAGQGNIRIEAQGLANGTTINVSNFQIIK